MYIIKHFLNHDQSYIIRTVYYINNIHYEASPKKNKTNSGRVIRHLEF